MSEVLAPRLELFGRLARFLAESDERISETMWVENGRPARLKASRNIPAQDPDPVFVVNADSGVKISSIMWGVLAANLITAIAVSLLYAGMR